MTLVDAGPLVALVNRRQDAHERCHAVLRHLPLPLLTTWAAFAEAMYILGTDSGWHGQKALWGMFQKGALHIAEPTVHMLDRIHALMEKYADLPMDLADASLVALAEERGLQRIFTIDSDFQTYRIGGKKHFILVP